MNSIMIHLDVGKEQLDNLILWEVTLPQYILLLIYKLYDMNIFKDLTKVGKLKAGQVLKDATYMEDNASLVCKDKTDSATLSTSFTAQHINYDLDEHIEFPRFCIIKTAARNEGFGMHSKIACILDTDDEPTEGSKNLVTSGALYSIISDLQNQINELKTKNRR